MRKAAAAGPTLRETLDYTPVELGFGTSGLRGLVADITQLEAYVNTRGFLRYLRRRRLARRGDAVYCAGDLRPSTGGLVPEQGGRGEILQVVLRAAEDAGLSPQHLGRIPSPALMGFAVRRRAASIMVTGSHLPFERNGIKYNTPAGEVLKTEEAPILAAVRVSRQAEYRRPAAECLFDARGMLKPEHRRPLPPAHPEGAEEYARRYLEAFPAGILSGARVLVWQHSAVSRDLLAEVLRALGAQVVAAGRSETFVPVDTEAVDKDLLANVQALVDAGDGPFDAVVSTDGDGDRPLVLAVEQGRVRFIPGDLLGLLSADFLGAREVTVPVSASDAIEQFFDGRGVTTRRTRIGSPYLIPALREVGWEGNGGFLTAAALRVPGGGLLEPLVTRDALLPILCVLAASRRACIGVGALLDRLPRRFGSSALLRPFPRERFQRIAAAFAPPRADILQTCFQDEQTGAIRLQGAARVRPAGTQAATGLLRIHRLLEEAFSPRELFAPVAWVNWLDGVRVGFTDGRIAHLRASGNAPELRVYAVAESQQAADAVVEGVLRGGVLPRLEELAGRAEAIEAFVAAPRQLPLRGAVQHYAWGGARFIPELLGLPNPESRPWAELWLGAHPLAPAQVGMGEQQERWVPLDALIRAAPRAVLGRRTARRFGHRLPYLFKVLDAREPLSLQAHPSRRQALVGFGRENAAGIPLDAPERNYRDDNAKPEVHAALTDLWMLHGFRSLSEIAETLAAVEELGGLFPEFGQRLRRLPRGAAGARRQLLRELYVRVMTQPRGEADARLSTLLGRLQRRSGLDKDSYDFWVLRAAQFHRDPGVLAIYLLNLVHLRPGQGTYQPAGTLHAYLEGVTVELMANSDNVLRGGLTAKHVDVPELLNVVDFRSGPVPVLEPRRRSPAESDYPTAQREFRLSRIELHPGRTHRLSRHGPVCLLLLEGVAALDCAGRRLELGRGGAALVPAGLRCTLRCRGEGRALLYRAGGP